MCCLLKLPKTQSILGILTLEDHSAPRITVEDNRIANVKVAGVSALSMAACLQKSTVSS